MIDHFINLAFIEFPPKLTKYKHVRTSCQSEKADVGSETTYFAYKKIWGADLTVPFQGRLLLLDEVSNNLFQSDLPL